MAEAAVRANLDESLDVERYFTSKVTLNLEPTVDEFSEPVDLLFRQVADSGVWIDVRLGQDVLCGGQPDPEDIGERHFHALLARDVDTSNACHRFCLPLPLLVLRIGADDHHGSVAANHLAVVAARLDGGSDFQRILGRGGCSCSRTMWLLESVGDPTACQVVRREFDPNTVPWQDSNEVHSKLPRDVGQHSMAVLKFDREHGVWERFKNRSLYFDRVSLGHGRCCVPFSP